MRAHTIEFMLLSVFVLLLGTTVLLSLLSYPESMIQHYLGLTEGAMLSFTTFIAKSASTPLQHNSIKNADVTIETPKADPPTDTPK